jgi:YbgC/YbaW family acyl-CoA thioester hydrolase
MPTTTIDVRWGELDPYNHVNHATYLSYCEEARIRVLDGIGWDMMTLERAGFRVVVVGIEVAFKRSAGPGDTLTVTTTLAELGASASTWRQVITRGDEVVVEATVRAACTDLDGKPVRTPQAFRTALKPLLEQA